MLRAKVARGLLSTIPRIRSEPGGFSRILAAKLQAVPVRMAIFATVAGALLPMRIYMCQVVGNEPLAGCLTSLVISWVNS